MAALKKGMERDTASQWETERPQQDEEQGGREAKRKGSSQPAGSERIQGTVDYWGLEISYSIHYFRTHFYMKSDNPRNIYLCVCLATY